MNGLKWANGQSPVGGCGVNVAGDGMDQRRELGWLRAYELSGIYPLNSVTFWALGISEYISLLLPRLWFSSPSLLYPQFE